MKTDKMLGRILNMVVVIVTIRLLAGGGVLLANQADASLATIHVLDDCHPIQEAMEARSPNESSSRADGSDSPIGFGETISGSINATAEMDTYTFSASAGDTVLIRMSQDSGGLDPEIRLYAPDGTELERTSAGTTAEIYSTLPDTGQYMVLAGDYGGTEIGDYGIFVQRLNNPGNVTPIGFGETISASIDMAAEMDTYTFSASAGDTVLIRMSQASGGLDPEIRLYAPDGTELERISAETTAEIYSTLPDTGQYMVLAGDYGGTETGEYSIYLQKTSSVRKPDLVITELKCDRENDRVGCVVKNVGDGVALAGHWTTLWVNDVEVCDDEVEIGLDSGESYEGWFDCYEWPEYQTIEVMLCADNYDAVVESNEDNNCRDCVLGICGDVAPYACCDGIVNMGDVVLLLNHVGHPGQYELCCEWSGDVAPCPASDGIINMGDVVLLLNYVGHPGEYELCCG